MVETGPEFASLKQMLLLLLENIGPESRWAGGIKRVFPYTGFPRFVRASSA